MDSPVLVIFGILMLLFVVRFVGRIVAHMVRNRRARLHAIRSIPLPRHTTLVSGEPSTQIEAVLLDVFDTEYRRRIEAEPRYERLSAEEVAELRVFLFQRAFRRKGPRILYEIEVGVPLQMKFQDENPDVCAWALKRLKANPPLFGKPDTIDDLVLKPGRFQRFLWAHGVGSAPVLFLEKQLRALPISIVPRSRVSTDSQADTGDGDNQLPDANDRPDGTRDSGEHLRELVLTLGERVLEAVETGDDAEVRCSIADARVAVLKASPDPPPKVVCEFLKRLDVYEERRATFEFAFAAETSKSMDDWAPWARDGLTAAADGGTLAELGEDAMLEAFKRHARRHWVTSSAVVTVARHSSIVTVQQRSEAQADEDDKPISAPAAFGGSAEYNTDHASEMGF